MGNYINNILVRFGSRVELKGSTLKLAMGFLDDYLI